MHHSPDLARSIGELFRMLRPVEELSVMLYHRRSVLYWYQIRYIEGYLHGESRFLPEVRLSSRYTDGERQEGNPYGSRLNFRILGTDIDFAMIQISQWNGLVRLIPRPIKKYWARRWGWSVSISGVARGGAR